MTSEEWEKKAEDCTLRTMEAIGDGMYLPAQEIPLGLTQGATLSIAHELRENKGQFCNELFELLRRYGLNRRDVIVEIRSTK